MSPKIQMAQFNGEMWVRLGDLERACQRIRDCGGDVGLGAPCLCDEAVQADCKHEFSPWMRHDPYPDERTCKRCGKKEHSV